jgi:hypothetical protein
VDVELEVELVAVSVDCDWGAAPAPCASRPTEHANKNTKLIENGELDFFMGNSPPGLSPE